MTSEALPAQPAPGIPRSLLVAALCFALGAGTSAALVGPANDPAATVLPLGWAAFAVCGAVLLDRGGAARLGRVLVALALVPLGVVLVAAGALATGRTAVEVSGLAETVVPAAILEAFDRTAPLQAVAVLVGLAWAGGPSSRPWLRRAGGVLGGAGALLVAVLATHPDPGPASNLWTRAGWAAVVLACLTVWSDAVHGAHRLGRTSRRRTAWLLLALAAAAGIVGVTARTATPTSTRTVAGIVLVVLAVCVTRLFLLHRFRPLDEHLLDVALVLASVAAAVGVGALVRGGAALTQMPSPDTSATTAAVLTAAAAAPAALWARRALLSRRYGPGVIAPSDVAVITQDLRAQADPRDLLDKAARMVAAASGCRDARLVLGHEPPEVPDTWTVYPLDVGGERVGSLAVQASGPDGLEPRQADDVARLVPTVALVARAVTLAVEAELSRRDVARERDAERSRILADLHDGLGPALAGMSMRVRAALRAGTEAISPKEHALLTDLAEGLATSRSDLRRLVSGITPAALDDHDLATALDRLVASFRTAGGPQVRLALALDVEPDADTTVAVYRCVAEGVTNALRHAGAGTVDVAVTTSAQGARVVVVDDGSGGPVVPGVGLSSLRARAEGLGGALTVTAVPTGGTRLDLEVPVRDGVAA